MPNAHLNILVKDESSLASHMSILEAMNSFNSASSNDKASIASITSSDNEGTFAMAKRCWIVDHVGSVSDVKSEEDSWEPNCRSNVQTGHSLHQQSPGWTAPSVLQTSTVDSPKGK